MLKTFHSMGMLLFLVLLCLAVGQLGVFFTTEATYGWYHTLHKPDWLAPSIVFPFVWTILYVLMAIAAWMVWRNKQSNYSRALFFWGIQLFLNALWTPLFFGYQAIFYSLVLIGFLWIFILITTLMFYKHSKLSAFLMFLYLLWVSYASWANFMIWRLNS